MSAVLVDTNGLGDMAHISLSGFDITLITGAGTFEQVPRRAKIIADSASQTIIIDGGDDRIIIGEGIADTIGHITYNIMDGGEGYDTLQLNRASRDGYVLYASRNDDGDATLADIADSFIAADEATGGLDDAAFIAHLYQTALEREATALELSEWNPMLANGHVDRGDVLLALVESAEMVALVGVLSTTFEVA